MRRIAELLRLKYELKLSHRAIAASLQMSPASVSDYVKRAESVKLTWPLPPDLSEEQLHAQLFSPLAASLPPPQPDWPVIHQEMRRKGVTLQLLWQEYRALCPQGLSYSQFCRQYRRQQGQLDPVMRFTHRAGENCFVDYAGLTIPWYDALTATVLEAQIFVGCLGASNYTYVEATAGQSLREWLLSHAHMFAFFGGVPQNCVCDNLKAGVTKAHRYDPDINLTYQHFAEYYGVAILPARASKPRDKAKVENAVQCVERHLIAPLRHHTFTSLFAINQALKAALPAYNAKPFQKLEGSRTGLFERLERPTLKALPPNAYEWSEWRLAKVHLDYHIVYDKHCYSVPYRLIGQQLKVRATASVIECYHDLARVACHRRAYRGGYTTLADHMPVKHQQIPDSSVQFFLEKAAQLGPFTHRYVQALLQQRAFPQQAFRTCQGILQLGQRYGQARLECACQRALALEVYRYRSIETMLRNGLESVPLSEEPALQLPCHDNLRGADYYQ